MSNTYSTIDIYDFPDSPTKKVIGTALFVQPGSGSSYGDFVGIVSSYAPEDVNFDCKVSIAEHFFLKYIPGGFAETSFAFNAFTQLMIATSDPIFNDLRNKVLVPYSQNLGQWGVEKVVIDQLASATGSDILSTIADQAVNGFVAQFMVNWALHSLVENLVNVTIPDPAPVRSKYDVHYEVKLADYLGATKNQLVFGSDSGANVFTGSGNDVVIGSPSPDTMSTGSGNDKLFGGGGDDVFSGGAGADLLYGGNGNDTFGDIGLGDIVAGGAGNDRLYFDLSTATTAIGINLLSGQVVGAAWTGVEFVSGSLGASNDSFAGGIQLEGLDGGAGTDSLALDYSGALADGRTVASISFVLHYVPYYGGIYGGYETINLSDGTTVQTEFGNFELLTIVGTSGADRIIGDIYDSTFSGGSGNDYLETGAGADNLFGGAGRDYVDGSSGNDWLYGGSNVDRIYGGDGQDQMTGGTGNDFLTGGIGNDRFLFALGFGTDRVTDFVAGGGSGDRIDFSALHLALSDLSFSRAGGGTNTVVTVTATGDSVILQGVEFGTFDTLGDLIL